VLFPPTEADITWCLYYSANQTMHEVYQPFRARCLCVSICKKKKNERFYPSKLSRSEKACEREREREKEKERWPEESISI
jgi:hypothetical protein